MAFYNPPPPTIGGAQPYAPKLGAPDLLINKPLGGYAGTVAVTASIVATWMVVAPQPIQARQFNPALFAAVASTDRAPGTSTPKIVTIDDDPLPQVNRKLPQPFVQTQPPRNLAAVLASLDTWRVEFVLPQTSSKLTPPSVDNPPRYRQYVVSPPVDPPLPTLGGKLSPGIPGQSVDPPPPYRQYVFAPVVDPPPPALPEKLAPGIPGQSVDNPPFDARQPPLLTVDPFILPQVGAKLVPVTAAAQVDNPPRKQGVTYVPPPDIDPSYQLQRRLLNPQLTAIAVDVPPGSAGPRIVPVDDFVLPQANRKLVPTTAVQADNPPFKYRRFSWGPGEDTVTDISSGQLVQPIDNPPFGAFYSSVNIVPLAWRPADPLPTLRRGLPPSALAVAVDTVLRTREPWAIQAAWRLDPPAAIVGKKLVPAQVADTVLRTREPWAIQASWRLDPPLPILGGKLSPGIPGQSVDKPPPYRAYVAPPTTEAPLPTLPDKLAPGIPGQSVDAPPPSRAQQPIWQQVDPLPTLPDKLVPITAAATADTVLSIPDPWAIQLAWRLPDPLPTLRSKLPPSILAVPVDYVTVTHEPWAIQAAWRIPDPLPTLRGKLTPSALAVAVDSPPGGATPAIVTVDDFVLPQVNRKLPQAAAAAQVDNPPFSSREPNIALEWRTPDPLPTLARKLPASVLAVPVDNPPFGLRALDLTAWAVPDRAQVPKQLSPAIPGQSVDNPPRLRAQQPTWPQPEVLPTLPVKLVPVAAADTVLALSQQWSIQLAWRIDYPLPTLPAKLVPITAAATADTVLSRPQAIPLGWWDVAALPSLGSKLNPSLLAVRVDNPPTTRISLDLTPWIPPQPLPTLAGKLNPSITAVRVDTVLYKPDISSIIAAWTPTNPLPIPSVKPGTIPVGPTPPPPTDGQFTVSGRDVRALFLFDDVSAPFSPVSKRTN